VSGGGLDGYLTVADVAGRFGLKPRTVRQYLFLARKAERGDPHPRLAAPTGWPLPDIYIDGKPLWRVETIQQYEVHHRPF